MWKCAFEGKLIKIDLSNAQPENNEIPDKAFWHEDEQGIYYDYYGNPSVRKPLPLREIKLPVNIGRIGDKALMFTEITTAEIPETVKAYGVGSFLGCRNLKGSIPVPMGMESIPDSCFMYCSSIDEINLPGSIRKLGRASFQTTGMKGDPFIIPDGVEEIPDGCFCNCLGITAFQLPPTLKVIGKRAFYALAGGPYEFEIPEGVEFIGEKAFEGNMFGRIVIPASVKEIGEDAFMESWLATELVIMDGSQLKKLPKNFMYMSDSLCKITLGDGIEDIEEYAFSACGKLSEVRFPSTLRSLYVGAFQGCSLSKITLPAGVESIGTNCFKGNEKSVAEISSDNPIPPSCLGAWNGLSTAIPVYVPKGSVDAYKADNGWSYFTNFIEKEGLPSGIGSVVSGAGKIGITADVNGITINGPESVTYAIYLGNGQLVTSGAVKDGGVSVELPAGLYLVNAGDTTAKIVL